MEEEKLVDLFSDNVQSELRYIYRVGKFEKENREAYESNLIKKRKNLYNKKVARYGERFKEKGVVEVTKEGIVHIFKILEIKLRDSTDGILIRPNRIFIRPLPLNKRRS